MKPFTHKLKFRELTQIQAGVLVIGIISIALCIYNERCLKSLLFLPILAFSAFYLYIGWNLIKKFSSGTFNKQIFFLDELLLTIEDKIHSNDRENKLLVDCIYKISENKTVDEMLLTGEIGNALKHLKQNFKNIHSEEQERSKISEDISKIIEFSKSNKELKAFGQKLLGVIVKTFRIQQAVFYHFNLQENKLCKTACYGEFQESNDDLLVDYNTGLIAQCIKDKKILTITNLPQTYLKINSGLGECTPKTLVLVPLIFKGKIVGILELYSLKEISDNQVSYLTRYSEAIAAELSEIERENTILLKSQELERQIRIIESEKRKNSAILEGCVDAVISFDDNGRINFYNKMAEEIFGFNKSEVTNTLISDIIPIKIVSGLNYGQLFTENNIEVKVRTEVSAYTKSNEEISLLLTSAQIELEDGILYTIFAQKISVDLF